jgi:hypothetical protein
MWAASRNFRPPNLTKGMLRRVSSTQRPLWLEVPKQHGCCFKSVPDSRFLQHAFDDAAGLVGLVAGGDQAEA